MPLSRSSIKKQLTEGMNAVFGLEYGRYPELWRDIYEQSSESSRAYVEDVLMTGTGAAPVKAEGAGVAYDEMQESYVARYMFETIAIAAAVTEEAIEDNLYGRIGEKIAKSLARSAQYTKNVKGVALLNSGFATLTGGDGQFIFSASHPLVNGGTGSNLLSAAADFSETAVEDLLVQIGDTTDDRGIPAMLKVKRALGPNELQFVMQRVLRSELRQGTSDNDLNAIKTMGSIPSFSSNIYLTDPDAWFLITDCPDGLKYIERTKLKNGMEGDFDSGNMRYKIRERYVFGISDWRGVFGTPGA
jgi:phage major head subunit gpT-like protein